MVGLYLMLDIDTIPKVILGAQRQEHVVTPAIFSVDVRHADMCCT